MSWFSLVLIATLAMIAARVFVKLRAARRARPESWDEKIIERLRSQGYAPFNDYPVDFFLALPDEAACAGVRARLEPEFSVDVKPVAEEAELHFSLHARKAMRLVVPDMQDITRRLGALAAEFHGRYDGWRATRSTAAGAGSAAGQEEPEARVILKRFEAPDETREFTLGRFELVHLGAMTIGRATYQPGWKWSTHLGPDLGLTRCSLEHVGLVLSGAATAAFDDGSVIELRAGQLFHIPAVPHDSWVVGNEPYVSLHFLGAGKYAQR
jgi:Regulator of ribonuclease activity B